MGKNWGRNGENVENRENGCKLLVHHLRSFGSLFKQYV